MHKIEEPRPSPSFLMDNVEVDINIYYSIAPTSFILECLFTKPVSVGYVE